jgi:hypothetical protein
MLNALRNLSRNQKIAIGAAAAVVVVVLVLVLATGGGGEEEAVTTTTTSTTEPTTTTTTEPPVAPLTGLPEEDEARRSRPALLVKVDNTANAMARHEGLDRADVVFVEQVEQGVTRLAATFHSEDATVGPVRSARTSDLGIGSLLQAPLFAYSGANSGVLGQVRNSPHLIDMGIDQGVATSVYTRNQRGQGLLRFFLPTAEIYEVARDGARTPEPLFEYLDEGEEAPGDPAEGVRVGYGGRAATVVDYDWNGSAWDRSQFGRPHAMAGGGARIAPANVVIMFTDYRPSPYRDVTGAVSPEAVLEGEGEVWVLTGGAVQRGRWSHPSLDDPITFTGDDGQPLRLTPGKTWIELAPGAGSATLKEPAPPPGTGTP